MGQRLVVSVKNNGSCLCKIYFHWSAYTLSALMEAKNIVDCIYSHDDKTENELQLRLIRFCEANGGGIDGGKGSSEWEYIQAMYPNEVFKKEGINRNCGLIALSEKGMEDIQSWSEGDLDIIIDQDLIWNGVYIGYEHFEDYKEEKTKWDDEFDKNMTIEDIPGLGCDLGEIDVNDIDIVINSLRNINGYVVRYGSEIYELIE